MAKHPTRLATYLGHSLLVSNIHPIFIQLTIPQTEDHPIPSRVSTDTIPIPLCLPPYLTYHYHRYCIDQSEFLQQRATNTSNIELIPIYYVAESN
ncbi:hypothetical protein BJX61DRAFT_511694 [Aspergillus egyptiacus]|nr:hypothetical protein BJX61DRAFT_511694 [Aspergillus egyptiacus]